MILPEPCRTFTKRRCPKFVECIVFDANFKYEGLLRITRLPAANQDCARDGTGNGRWEEQQSGAPGTRP